MEEDDGRKRGSDSTSISAHDGGGEKKARTKAGAPLTSQPQGSNALSVALELCPYLFGSNELAAASQTCCDAHKAAVVEASRRWDHIGWGAGTGTVLPKGMSSMGLFSRLTSTRVLEGLVVAAEGHRTHLCDRLTAFGARVVETTSFEESLRVENIDFCVWTSFDTPPPTKENGDTTRHPVMWEPVLESFLFSPWVSEVIEIQPGDKANDIQLAELQRINTEEDIGMWCPQCDYEYHDLRKESWYGLFYPRTHTNVVSGDVVRYYEWDDGGCLGVFFYQKKDQEKSIPFLSNQHRDLVSIGSWTAPNPASSSSESVWNMASITILYKHSLLPGGYHTPCCLAGPTFFEDWSSATPLSVNERSCQWRECLQALKAQENLDYERDGDKFYWLFPEDGNGNCYNGEELQPNVPCAAVLRWALATSFECDE